MSEGKYDEPPTTADLGEVVRKRIEDSLLTEEHLRKLERRWERAQYDDDEAAMQGLSASVPLLIREIRRLRADAKVTMDTGAVIADLRMRLAAAEQPRAKVTGEHDIACPALSTGFAVDCQCGL